MCIAAEEGVFDSIVTGSRVGAITVLVKISLRALQRLIHSIAMVPCPHLLVAL